MPFSSTNIAAGASVASLCAVASKISLLASTDFDPLEFAADLGLQMIRQHTAITSPQRIQTLSPVPAQGFVSIYALCEQQPLNAIDVPDPLSDQRLTLAANAAAVFLHRCGRPDYRTDPRFATLVRQKRANQRFTVDPVSLRPPTPTRCRDRGRINNVAFDPFTLQRAMDPESQLPE